MALEMVHHGAQVSAFRSVKDGKITAIIVQGSIRQHLEFVGASNEGEALVLAMQIVEDAFQLAQAERTDELPEKKGGRWRRRKSAKSSA